MNMISWLFEAPKWMERRDASDYVTVKVTFTLIGVLGIFLILAVGLSVVIQWWEGVPKSTKHGTVDTIVVIADKAISIVIAIGRAIWWLIKNVCIGICTIIFYIATGIYWIAVYILRVICIMATAMVRVSARTTDGWLWISFILLRGLKKFDSNKKKKRRAERRYKEVQKFHSPR